MKLTILGSGTCQPSLKRSGPGYHLKIKNKNILVDCGPGTLTKLEKSKIGYKNIDIIFLTHFHADHISDLQVLFQALNWTPKFKRTKDLQIFIPPKSKKFVNRFIKPIMSSPLPDTYKIIFQEIKATKRFKGFTVSSQKTKHDEYSVAYKFTQNKKSIVFSGDTGYDENIIKFSKKTDILLLECTNPPNVKTSYGHLNPTQCGQIAHQAYVKKLILTHLYSVYDDKTMLNTAKK